MLISIKKGFTLIEMIVVMVMISTGMVGLIAVINYGLDFTEKTRKEIIAINMAREGMEGIYNIRDTNWLKRSGKRDKCWLKKDPLKDEDSSGCGDDEWMGSENYILSGTTSSQGEDYYVLSGIADSLTVVEDNEINSEDENYKMCRDDIGFWYNCPSENWDKNDIKEGRFFRKIEGKGLYDKTDASSLSCDDGEDNSGGIDCGDDTAKEYRFCSVVEYIGGGLGKVELCGVITNFEK